MNVGTLKRLDALEKNQRQRVKHNHEGWEDDAIEKSGMSREELVSKYGSMPAYAYHLMISGNADSPPILLPAHSSYSELYMSMLKGQS